MKGHEFRILSNALESLRSSTFIRFASGAVACELSGRRSPYISHRTVEYGGGLAKVHSYHALVSNNKYTVAIGGGDLGALGEEITAALAMGGLHVVVDTVIPRGLVDGILRDLAEYLSLSIHGDLIPVAFGVRRVASWDDNGKPVFAELPTPPPDSAINEVMAK